MAMGREREREWERERERENEREREKKRERSSHIWSYIWSCMYISIIVILELMIPGSLLCIFGLQTTNHTWNSTLGHSHSPKAVALVAQVGVDCWFQIYWMSIRRQTDVLYDKLYMYSLPQDSLMQCIYVRTYMHTYIHACMHACIQTCMTYRQPARQTDSQTARQPDSQTAKQPDSQTARQPDSQTASQPARQPDRQTDTHTHTHIYIHIYIYIYIYTHAYVHGWSDFLATNSLHCYSSHPLCCWLDAVFCNLKQTQLIVLKSAWIPVLAG